jgi:hypothetical protein
MQTVDLRDPFDLGTVRLFAVSFIRQQLPLAPESVGALTQRLIQSFKSNNPKWNQDDTDAWILLGAGRPNWTRQIGPSIQPTAAGLCGVVSLVKSKGAMNLGTDVAAGVQDFRFTFFDDWFSGCANSTAKVITTSNVVLPPPIQVTPGQVGPLLPAPPPTPGPGRQGPALSPVPGGGEPQPAGAGPGGLDAGSGLLLLGVVGVAAWIFASTVRGAPTAGRATAAARRRNPVVQPRAQAEVRHGGWSYCAVLRHHGAGTGTSYYRYDRGWHPVAWDRMPRAAYTKLRSALRADERMGRA